VLETWLGFGQAKKTGEDFFKKMPFSGSPEIYLVCSYLCIKALSIYIHIEKN